MATRVVVEAGPDGVESLLIAAPDAVARSRRLATGLGPDSSRAWDLAELATSVECAARNLARSPGTQHEP